MKFYDIGISIPSIILPAVITATEKFMKKKILKCLLVSKLIDIGLLIPSNLTQVIMDVMKVVDIGLLRKSTLPQVIEKVVDVVQV